MLGFAEHGKGKMYRGRPIIVRQLIYRGGGEAVLHHRMLLMLLIVIVLLLIWSWGLYHRPLQPAIGQAIDEQRGVPVYYNGLQVDQSHGPHYSPDGYYYGQKWQCVEFVKRYYYQVFHHRMPDVFGDARDFWDADVASGTLNYRRGLLQYRNGEGMPPRADDLLVFTGGNHGHVAVVSKVGKDEVEIVQQNVTGGSRQRLAYGQNAGCCYIGDGRQPVGWLRLEDKGPTKENRMEYILPVYAMSASNAGLAAAPLSLMFAFYPGRIALPPGHVQASNPGGPAAVPPPPMVLQ